MKTCLGCNQELQLECFRKKSAAKDGRTARCKVCLNAERSGVCQDCGATTSFKSKARCKQCMGRHMQGENNPRWLGGKRITSEGYIILSNYHNHPNADSKGRIFQHTLVMSEHLGRPLLKGENVHHINGVRDDNRIENLELWSTSQPSGQRVADKVAWAKELLALYDPGALR